jgi:2-octaprenyl-6-methoxyphenol hydroxylase
MINSSYDVVIVGAGLSGLSLACLLGHAGIDTAIIDRLPVEERLQHKFDGRTTALSYGSAEILTDCGLWDRLEQLGSPITDIDIRDGSRPFLLHFDHEESGMPGAPPFGWIIENRNLRRELVNYLAACDTVTDISPASVGLLNPIFDGMRSLNLSDGRQISAQLIIAADGRRSMMRDQAGIDTVQLNYKQKALVFGITHECPHDGLAVEHFYQTGPFAILPLPDGSDGTHRSGIVWTVENNSRYDVANLPDDLFSHAVANRCPDHYGQIDVIGDRRAYPLSLIHAKRYIDGRFVLIGEAAHGIHPIAGQGFNLSMRDIGVLAQMIITRIKAGMDIGEMGVLQKYQQLRRPDNVKMIAATDLLNRLFSNDILPVRWARSIGLGIVERIPPLKKYFMKQAMTG